MSLDRPVDNVQLQPAYGELAIISSSGVETQCIPLNKHEYTIGRSRRCDVRIKIKTVSRLHVRIQHDSVTHKMTLVNCGSGEDDLFVNEIFVKQGCKVQLKFGDVIELSGKRFKLHSPRKGRSAILDETRLCSQPPVLKRSESCHIPGGGAIEEQYKKRARSPSFARLNLMSGATEKRSPDIRKSTLEPLSELALGTPDTKANTNTSKSVRFSHYNEVKTDGIQAYSPATKRRRVADRKPTPGPGRLFKSGQLPQDDSRNTNSSKRLSERKQVMKRSDKVGISRSKGSQYVKQPLLLTPTVKQMPKTEEERRKEIMRRLLASSSPPDATDEPIPKFVL